VVERASGEHWAGKLYMRHASIYVTRVLVPTNVAPDVITWAMLGFGVAAAAVSTVPHLWSAVLAVLLIQLQGLFDCVDGELARWQRRTGPAGVFIDRLGHYVTDAGLAAGIGVRADGGFGHVGGWTALGLATACLILLVKAETDLVLVARYAAGLPKLPDAVETAAPRRSGLRAARRWVAVVPVNRVLLAMEMTFLLLVAAVADAAGAAPTATRTLSAVLLGTAGFVVVARLPSILSSSRLK
jgi:phosphatidylglycerophosphate synthase